MQNNQVIKAILNYDIWNHHVCTMVIGQAACKKNVLTVETSSSLEKTQSHLLN